MITRFRIIVVLLLISMVVPVYAGFGTQALAAPGVGRMAQQVATPTAVPGGGACTVNAVGGAQFTKIQDAVNDVSCETVNVAAGTYTENITITRNVNVIGTGKVIVDGNNVGRVFYVFPGEALLEGLTIQNGVARPNDPVGNFGGGIANGGFLTIRNSTVISNAALRRPLDPSSGINATAPGAGGGIYNNNQLTLINSTVVNNRAESGQSGGGVSINAAGITNNFSMTLQNSTIANNGGTNFFDGYQIQSGSGAKTFIRNSIIAGSPSKANCLSPVSLNFSNNLDSDGTCGVGTATDPLLSPLGLQDNGGSTQTIALQPNSPAIDAANAANCPATDQRGVTRPQGAGCDIGAYEFVGAPSNTPTPTPTAAPPTATPATGILNLTVRVINISYMPLSNWPITVYDMSRGEAFVAGATTNSNGEVRFTLPAGKYKICETVQNGYAVSYPPTNCFWQTLDGSNPNPFVQFINAMTAPTTPAPTPTEPAVCTSLNRNQWVASSSYGGNIALAIDPSKTTFWNNGVARQGQGQWFSVDLGEQKTFNGIILDNASDPNNYPRKIGGFVSADGGVFTKVGEATPSGAISTFSFAPRTARYVSVEILQSNFTASWSISDLDVCSGGAVAPAQNSGVGIGKQFVLKAQGFVPLTVQTFLPVVFR